MRADANPSHNTCLKTLGQGHRATGGGFPKVRHLKPWCSDFLLLPKLRYSHPRHREVELEHERSGSYCIFAVPMGAFRRSSEEP